MVKETIFEQKNKDNNAALPIEKRPLPLLETEKADEVLAAPKPVSFPTAKTENPPKLPKVTQAPTFVFVSGSRVNLRENSGTQYKKVGAFSKGAKLIQHETKAGWARVSGQENGRAMSGWMSAKYLSDSPPKATAKKAPSKRAVAVPSSREVTQAKKALIRQSIANYSGNCPCPYNRDRAGRKCGKRSAWSRPGGYAPLCYESDVNRSRLTAYFARLGKNWP